MGIEGQLDIRLTHANGAVQSVNIVSSRPVHASKVFKGKSIAESQKLIPLLYSICATAQASASARACEQALGLQVGARTDKAREALVEMETLREHLWRILLDWPSFIGGQADKSAMAHMVSIQRDYQQALCSGTDVFQTGGADCEPDSDALNDVFERLLLLLREFVFGLSANQWLALSGLKPLTDWAHSGRTIAAEMISQVIQNGFEDAGSCASVALPMMTSQFLNRAMDEAEFVSQPQWDGHCCETSSLTRCDSPLLNALKQEYGNGLLVRLVARLTEIAQLAEKLLLPSIPGRSGHDSRFEAVNPGIGQAAAARGQLVHRVELNGGVIGNYQILAPTEWNFHPQGVVAQSLCALKGDLDQVKRHAKLLINAIDPCVAFELVIIHGEA